MRLRLAAFGRGTRIVLPLRIVGSRYVRLVSDVTLQYAAYIAILKLRHSPPTIAIGGGTLMGHRSHTIVTRRVEVGEDVLIADRV